MIQSAFINDILDLLLDDVEEEKTLRSQVTFLREGETEHEGSRFYIGFILEDEALKFKSQEDYVLTGLKIKLPQLANEASATLFIYEGLIDYIEIMAHNESYPQTEPTVYTLRQEFGDRPRIIERP